MGTSTSFLPESPAARTPVYQRVLTYRRARMLAVVLVALYATAWAFELLNGTPPLNAAGVPLVGDYIAFHAAGALVRSGLAAKVYDRASVVAVQSQLLDGRIPGFYDGFRNPPFFVLPFVALSAVPMPLAFALWTVFSVACTALAVRLLAGARWRGVLLLALAFPPVYFGLVDGENASLGLLLYVLIYRSLRGHSAWAGVWMALGLFKPQLFVVFPLVLLACRMWRGVLAYAACAVVLALVSLVVVGVDGLQAWFRAIVDFESGNAAANAWRMASLKAFFDQLLPGVPGVSLALYGVCAVALLGMVVWLWSANRASLPMTWVLTCLAAVLVDPHLVDYDLTVLVSAGVVLLIAEAHPLWRWLVAGVYVSTLLRPEVPLGGSAVLITPVVLILLVWIAMSQVQPMWPARLRRARLTATPSA